MEEMRGFWQWIKSNKAVVVLGAVVLWLVWQQTRPRPLGTFRQRETWRGAPLMDVGGAGLPPAGGGKGEIAEELGERMVAEESYISCVVEDVRERMREILERVEAEGGYMVSSSINQPEESPFATVIVRVPRDKRAAILDYVRGLAAKVTSERLEGWDVTDEYVDLEARLRTLEKTKAKFEEILEKAEKVDEILRVQREIINLQEQIDRLKGREEYLEKIAENAKLTIYLSTDEWQLPYMPEEPSFRPKVVFKQAVRSLVRNLRRLMSLAIWLGVYSVVWLPVVLIVRWWRRRKKVNNPRG